MGVSVRVGLTVPLSKFLERLLQTYLAKKEIIKKVKHIHKTSTILLVNHLIEFVRILTLIRLFLWKEWPKLKKVIAPTA